MKKRKVTLIKKNFKKRFLLFAMADSSTQYDIDQIPFGLNCVIGSYDTLRGARMAYKAFERKAFEWEDAYYGRPITEGQILDSKTRDIYELDKMIEEVV